MPHIILETTSDVVENQDVVDILEALVAAGPQERGHGSAGQCAGCSMVKAVSPARVFKGAEALVEAS